MATVQGAYLNCGNGLNFSVEFTCTGSNCSDFTGVLPGLTCTAGTMEGTMKCSNGVICTKPSNITSTFLIDTPGTGNVTSIENITIGGQSYTIIGNGVNFTYTNNTASQTHSAASYRKPVGSLTFFAILFSILVIFATPSIAQSPAAEDLAALNNQFHALEPILLTIEKELCNFLVSTLYDADEAAVATTYILEYLSFAAVAELAAGGEVVLAIPVVGEHALLIASVVTGIYCGVLSELLAKYLVESTSHQASD